MSDPRIIITLGDVNGIGPEILLKFHKMRPDLPILCVGDRTALLYWSRELGLPFHFEVIDLNVRYHPEPRTVSAVAGAAAAQAVERGYEEAKNRGLPLVTLPLSKEAVALSRSGFTGHTELLATLDGKTPDEVVMFLTGPRLSVVPLTRHIPLSAVSQALTVERVVRQVTVARAWFGERHGRAPKIWLAGLNPHAGEGGRIGVEEVSTLVPALIELRRNGIDIEGPLPADTMFATGPAAGVDLFFGCYHDQVLAPFKLLHFDEGINATLGLSVLRASPDHGTAFPIAGKSVASEKSFAAAVDWALPH
ncbi:MAG TPA: 4-hydroxythreonine-4-phosphate dehydrogenase PdxA [bacterium]|nr:4-hydroxythreonine-4-phosphate dehydrogenase PdxA [bacterium]